MVYVDFYSEPTGAAVYWDGKFLGRTLLRNFKTVPGTYKCEMRKSGFEDWEDKIIIGPRDLAVNVTGVLNPIGVETGELRFESTPSYAKIDLNSQYIGKTPETVRGLAPGRYYWIFRKDGYEMESGRVTVYSGKRTTVDIDLTEEKPEPEIVTVNIYCEEKGTGLALAAKFYIDDKYLGYTPKTITLESGDHTLKATLSEYKDFLGTFNARDGGAYWATLEKIIPPTPPDDEEPPTPPGYPKTITRNPYSFVVNNELQEIQIKDFLGIDPAGKDIDTYLSTLTQAQLVEWKNYWVSIWTGLKRNDIITFVIQMYNKYSEEPIIVPDEETFLEKYWPYALFGGGALIIIASQKK